MPVYFEGKRKSVRLGGDLVEVRFGKKTKKEAFAVFSADDNSLNFYKRVEVPNVGDTFEGKNVTGLYKDIETSDYSSEQRAPWYPSYKEITTCVFVDEIKPISTAYWFNNCFALVSIDLTNLNTSSITNMSSMFYNCSHLTSINVSNFNTSNVINMSNMFYNCSRLTSLDTSNWDTSLVTDINSMFSYCAELISLNLSTFDTSSVKNADFMFLDTFKLQKIKLGKNFAWKGVNGYLLKPDAYDIPHADGKWYAVSDGKGYTPSNIPSNKADTYYAYPPQAFAVYSDDDKSLNFYKRFGVPKAGEQFDGKTVAGVYTGIENAQYEPEWESIKQKIKYVTAIDKISPVFMSGWFANMHNLHTADLNKIDVSKTVDLSYIFYMSMSSNEPFRVNIESWNISDVCNINSMFDELIPGGSVGGIACIILGSGSAKIAARLPFAQAETGYGAMNVKTKQPESYEQIAAGNGGEYVFKRINYGLYAWNGDYWKR